MGKKREFLRVTNDALKDHKVYVGVRDYGRQLSVSWFHTVEPSLMKGLLSKALTQDSQALSFALDLFDQEELQAYVSTVHHAVKEVVQGLMEEFKQDASKINWKSTGYLELW